MIYGCYSSLAQLQTRAQTKKKRLKSVVCLLTFEWDIINIITSRTTNCSIPTGLLLTYCKGKEINIVRIAVNPVFTYFGDLCFATWKITFYHGFLECSVCCLQRTAVLWVWPLLKKSVCITLAVPITRSQATFSSVLTSANNRLKNTFQLNIKASNQLIPGKDLVAADQKNS